jgi:hypothetical protein
MNCAPVRVFVYTHTQPTHSLAAHPCEFLSTHTHTQPTHLLAHTHTSYTFMSCAPVRVFVYTHTHTTYTFISCAPVRVFVYTHTHTQPTHSLAAHPCEFLSTHTSNTFKTHTKYTHRTPAAPVLGFGSIPSPPLLLLVLFRDGSQTCQPCRYLKLKCFKIFLCNLPISSPRYASQLNNGNLSKLFASAFPELISHWLLCGTFPLAVDKDFTGRGVWARPCKMLSYWLSKKIRHLNCVFRHLQN